MWFDVLTGDDRSAWDSGLMPDPRVTHFWDENRDLGTWLAQREEYRDFISGPLAWDIFFLYGPRAEWTDAPLPVLDSGSTIISSRESLREHLAPMLARD